MSLAENETALTIASAFEIISFAHGIIVFSYHLYKTLLKKQCVSKLQSLSVLSIVLFLIFIFLTILTSWSLHPTFISCKIFTDTIAVIYFQSKITLYFLLIERLFTVFHSSAHAFTKSFKIMFRTGLILWMLITTILIFYSGDGYYNPTTNECYDRYPFWSAAVTAGGDFFIGITTSILFTRRLMMLHIATINNTECSKTVTSTTTTNTQYDHDPETPDSPQSPSGINRALSREATKDDIIAAMKSNKKLLEIVNKFTFLTFVSIFTTLLSLACVGVFEVAGLWLSIDGMVNVWAIVLMFGMCASLYISRAFFVCDLCACWVYVGVHHRLYKRMCKKLQKAIICNECLTCYSCHCCCCKITTEDEEELGHVLEMQDNKSNSLEREKEEVDV